MEYLRPAADDSEIRILGNSIGQIEAEISHAEGAIREVAAEIKFLHDEGATERESQFRLAVGHRAVRLAAHMPRLQAVLEQIKEVAGPEALKRASVPVQFER